MVLVSCQWSFACHFGVRGQVKDHLLGESACKSGLSCKGQWLVVSGHCQSFGGTGEESVG